MKMRAVVIVGSGGVDCLEIQQVLVPGPLELDQVLVQVRTAALNRADVLQRRGKYPAPADAPQDIPGLEFAGEVAAVGPDVKAFSRGDRVFGITAGGAQAEYVMSPESHLVIIPESLDWVQAAAVPEAFITAHDALFTQASLKPGETVLIHAVGSGVGIAAAQLVGAAGATAFGTSRSAAKLALAQDCGVARTIVATADQRDIVAAVQEWTSNCGVNIVLDLVGADYLKVNLDVLAVRGRLVFVGTTSGSRAELDIATVMRKRLHLFGTVLRSRSKAEKASATSLFAKKVVPLLKSGKVRPVVDRVFALSEVRAAHEYLESNLSFGKVVLQL